MAPKIFSGWLPKYFKIDLSENLLIYQSYFQVKKKMDEEPFKENMVEELSKVSTVEDNKKDISVSIDLST